MKLLCTLLAIAILGTSCATVMSGTKKQVTFTCNQPNATVSLNFDTIGVTNQPILIPRKDLSSQVLISKDGCETVKHQMPSKVTPTYWINLPFILVYGIGLIPVVVDFATGAVKDTDAVQHIQMTCDSTVVK